MLSSFLGFLFVFLSFGQDESAFNRNMIDLFQQRPTRTEEWPSEVRAAITKLDGYGITAYTSYSRLLGATRLQEAILHEYYRQQLTWGMPWLPLSWLRSDLQHSEEAYASNAANIEYRLNRMDLRNSDDNLFLGYLLTRSIYHYHDNANFERSVRGLAESFYRKVPAFYDLRLEIHQEPSPLTVQRVEAFMKANPGYERELQQILLQLRSLFGQGGLQQFLKDFEFSTEDRSILENVVSVSASLTGSQVTSQRIQQALRADTSMAKLAAEKAKLLREGSFACSRPRRFDCKYSMLDYLGQLQDAALGLKQALLSGAQQSGYKFSPQELVQFTQSSVMLAMSIGILDRSGTQLLQDPFRSGPLDLEKMEEWVQNVEAVLAKNSLRMRGMFGPELAKFRIFMPEADIFIDETIRESSLLALGNLHSRIAQWVQSERGLWFELEGGVKSASRVLSPGIARGNLIVPKDADLMNSSYKWNPEGIYFLRKTPALLQKVAGILTCDSGSVISHVNLLASNHGIANVKVDCKIEKHLQKLIGNEVFLTALPNGESRMILASSATSKELQVYNEFHKIKSAARVTLSPPSNLNDRAPLRLEQLRMSDAGKIAGGKACGQGELAALFPGTVPQAWVLPFGVYHEHVTRTGLKDWIKQVLSDPSLKGTSPVAVQNRTEALQLIRQRIQETELARDLKLFLIKALSSPPYAGRGLFVRSDTSAEDLPGFVGAGLNETIPNVVGLDNVFEAIKRVWSSPFTEKAYSWRNDLIENPWDVYPSVVIQIALNSDVAGVMVVGDTMSEDLEDVIHLAANQGLGITTVNGEYFPEELIVSRKTGQIHQVRRAYADKQKRLKADGGITDLPADDRARLIGDPQAKTLAEIGDKVQKHLAVNGVKEKWDLEWAILGNDVKLVQLRAFNGNKVARNVAALKTLEKSHRAPKTYQVQDAIIKLEVQ